MSNYSYSPEKLFKQIRSDADVQRYIKLYKHCGWMLLSLIWLCAFVPAILVININFNSHTSAFLVLETFLSMIIGLILFLVLMVYEEKIEALKPIAGTSRCLVVSNLLSDYMDARAIRDEVLKQGRQLYVFDADLMEKTKNTLSDTSRAEIEAACKRIYNMERSV